MLKVLIQSSALFSAILSAKGGSRAILDLGKQGRIQLYTSQDIIDEVKENLHQDYPEYFNQIDMFVKNYNLEIYSKLSDKEALRFKTGYIDDPDDVHVVAVADKLDIDYLISLDKKHFLQNTQLAKKLDIRIVSPGEFLEESGYCNYV